MPRWLLNPEGLRRSASSDCACKLPPASEIMSGWPLAWLPVNWYRPGVCTRRPVCHTKAPNGLMPTRQWGMQQGRGMAASWLRLCGQGLQVVEIRPVAE
jgi:hypothetical protein